MSAPALRHPALKWIYNHNPFYFISALLMLYSVRSAYGELRIGYINTWIMMGVLAGYTAVLAAIGVLIVRRGKVWEDARSILVTLLLLFLAVSVSADDLFATIESKLDGGLLLVCGYLFCAVVTESVLRGAHIRLPWQYRVPLHLMLVLFYVAPWWCSPELHPRSVAELEWSIFLFPVAAAAILLSLWPAVRRGPALVAQNGTPWGWPMFPWSAFAVVTVAVVLRTFALCMTFGPTGPIWIPMPKGNFLISFDTMWGPYFLVPIALALLVLFVEGSIVTGNHKLLSRLMWGAPALLLLAIPVSDAPVARGFLDRFMDTLGSPLWLTIGVLLAFYGLAWLRNVPGAVSGVLSMTALLTIVGPETIDLRTLTAPQAWPLFVIGSVMLAGGFRRRSSFACTLAGGFLAVAVRLSLPTTPLSDWQNTLSLHLLGLLIIAISLSMQDRFAHGLRWLGAALIPAAVFAAMLTDTPLQWRLGYVIAVTLCCYVIALRWKSKAYLYAFTLLLGLGGYGGAVLLYRSAAGTIGKAATTSFVWSCAALVIACLISAHKASWLPPRLFPRWRNGGNGHHPSTAPARSVEGTEPGPALE